MKNTTLKQWLLWAVVPFFLTGAVAQVPQKMSYQAVIRNGAGALVVNAPIGMRVSILQGAANGTVVYKELYNPNPQTNANGLVSVEIGNGIPIQGAFEQINWAAGPYFVQVETDAGGGTNYNLIAVNELLSVPFALFAASGNEGPQGEQGPPGPPGVQGTPGSVWLTGSSDPDPGWGQPNDCYLNTTTGDYYQKAANGEWVFKANLSGPQGPAGVQGPQGVQGVEGPQGDPGPPGAANISGATNYLVKFNSSTSGTFSKLYDDGNAIGLGTTTPSDLLDVRGNVRGYNFRGDVLNDKGTTQPLRLYGNGPVLFGADNNNDDNVLDRNNFVWYNNGELYPNIQMVLSEPGYLGIGTPTPSAQLHTTGAIRFESLSGTGTRQVVADANGVLSAVSASETHYIGESYGGGYVFHVYDGGRHGLICAKTDQSASMRWSAGTDVYTMAKSDGVNGGEANTHLIIARQGYGDGNTYAARLCNEYSVTENGVKYADWYLPSFEELSLLSQQRNVIGGFAEDFYWSSSEENQSEARYIRFSSLQLPILFFKSAQLHVRAIRAF